MPRITLPSGGWADLRDPADLRHKDERRVRARISDHEKPALVAEDLTDGVIAVSVVAWEVPYLPNAPLPADEFGILGELEIEDYQTLEKETLPAYRRLFPRPASVSDTGAESPTPPASG